MSRVAPDRVALDYLSPLPPVRSGISEYSVDLLPALEAELGGRLRVVRLDGQPVDEAIVRRFNPVAAARTANLAPPDLRSKNVASWSRRLAASGASKRSTSHPRHVQPTRAFTMTKSPDRM